jgi:hypothetical protein
MRIILKLSSVIQFSSSPPKFHQKFSIIENFYLMFDFWNHNSWMLWVEDSFCMIRFMNSVAKTTGAHVNYTPYPALSRMARSQAVGDRIVGKYRSAAIRRIAIGNLLAIAKNAVNCPICCLRPSSVITQGRGKKGGS